MLLRGKHNVQNACAAALAARLAGVSPVHIERALEDFRGLPHRMEHVRDLGGVAFFDDSKATNVGAAVAAIDGLADIEGRIVLVAGGRHKGGSFEQLREKMQQRGRAVIALGEAALELEHAFVGSHIGVETASSMDDSVRRARGAARPGDVVLLAPACASYDMFRSYAHRGEEFQRAVRALREAP
jgi:UDP-N-acetylmuramoylalanine--D-glutamate ligase